MIIFNEDDRELPPISVGLAFAMVFEHGIQLPVYAEYEDPVVLRIAQRMQAARDEIQIATTDLIKRYNLSTEVKSVVQLEKRADAPTVAKILGVTECGRCGSRLIPRGEKGMYCPCWEPTLIEPAVVDNGWVPSSTEICGRKSCMRVHVDQCCLCGKPLCGQHMADGCCGHTPAISDRQITEEFQLEERYEDEHAPDAECSIPEALSV